MNLIKTKIHNKLITDFNAAQYDNSQDVFGNVKKYYKLNSMNSQDLLVMGDDTVDDPDEGIVTTEREYGFLTVYVEHLESSIDDNEASIRIERMNNVEDYFLDYVEKIGPNNLREWGQSQSPVIDVERLNLINVLYQDERSENGYTKVQVTRFKVHVNVNARNL